MPVVPEAAGINCPGRKRFEQVSASGGELGFSHHLRTATWFQQVLMTCGGMVRAASFHGFKWRAMGGLMVRVVQWYDNNADKLAG